MFDQLRLDGRVRPVGVSDDDRQTFADDVRDPLNEHGVEVWRRLILIEPEMNTVCFFISMSERPHTH